MPIVGDGEDVLVVYHIPSEIKQNIPDSFYIAFAGELHSVFGPMVSEKDDDGYYGLSYMGGTAGWAAAFRAACDKLRMQWLLDYYNSLEWYDSDIFDMEMENMIVQKFYEVKETSVNAYYLYLIGEQNK